MVDITLTDKVEKLYEIIASKVGVKTDNWMLNFGGVIMQKDKTFQDYKIK